MKTLYFDSTCAHLQQNLPLLYSFVENHPDDRRSKVETCRRHIVKWKMIACCWVCNCRVKFCIISELHGTRKTLNYYPAFYLWISSARPEKWEIQAHYCMPQPSFANSCPIVNRINLAKYFCSQARQSGGRKWEIIHARWNKDSVLDLTPLPPEYLTMTGFFNVPWTLLSTNILQFEVICFAILQASLNKPNNMLWE
jgi:hypothetical protein